MDQSSIKDIVDNADDDEDNTSLQSMYDNISLTIDDVKVLNYNREKADTGEPGEDNQSNNSFLNISLRNSEVQICTTRRSASFCMVRANANAKFIRIRRAVGKGHWDKYGTDIFTTTQQSSDKMKPGRLRLPNNMEEDEEVQNCLLTYFWVYSVQPDQKELDLNMVLAILDLGVSINTRDVLGQTALFAIVRDWNADVTRFALQQNADANMQDELGRTPLHLACALNYDDVVCLLLERGADPHLLTHNEEQSCVHYAAKYNSLEALKNLEAYGCCMTERDSWSRSPLFVAAEMGSERTAKYLLELGAPVGVHDVHGNSLMTHLVEKLPSLVPNGLSQFCSIQNDQPQKYINMMEDNGRPAETLLYVITAYEEMNLIMNSTIQASAARKWVQFGRKDALRQLIIALVYVASWTILIGTFGENGFRYGSNIEHWEKHGWKVIVELIVVVLPVYFFIYDIKLHKRSSALHMERVCLKRASLLPKYSFCHPSWPYERKFLKKEEKKLKEVPRLARKQNFWLAYEYVNVFLTLMIIILRILSIHYPDSTEMLWTHRIMAGLNMMVAYVRLIKISMRFLYVSLFLRAVSSSFSSFMQITFLYIQFYVPFVAAIWLWFGKTERTSGGSKSHFINKNYDTFDRSLRNIFYQIFAASFEQETIRKLETVDMGAAQTIIAFFHFLTTVITLSIIIAFITSKLSYTVKQSVGKVLLYQARILLLLEQGMDKKEKIKLPRCQQQPKKGNQKEHVSTLEYSAERITNFNRVSDTIGELSQQLHHYEQAPKKQRVYLRDNSRMTVTVNTCTALNESMQGSLYRYSTMLKQIQGTQLPLAKAVHSLCERILSES